MLTACWSVKGGSGTTVVAAGLALAGRSRSGPPGLLVDLAGDLPLALGMTPPSGPGVSEWLEAAPSVPPDALARLEEPVAPGLTLLHRGHGPLPGQGGDLLLQVLVASGRSVVIDCGTLSMATPNPVAERLAVDAARSLLVTRSCFLAVRRARDFPIRPSGLVVLREVGRVLDDPDVANCLGLPIVASLAVDPAVARAVDSGLLLSRLPRSFSSALREVA